MGNGRLMMTEPIKESRPSVREAALALMDAQPAVKSRIFIVDDHAMFREGLCQLIDREPDMAVCGDAASAAEALRGLSLSKPDLVIVDLSLEGGSGIELIKAIKNQYDDLPVLVVSMHDEALYAERALRAGAAGYVMKQEPSRTVKIAIRKVFEGGIHLSDKMVGSVVAKFFQGKGHEPASLLETLSDREKEVFRMLGQGKGIRHIAKEMNVSIPTINTFRNRIKEKLHLKTSTEVMLHAIQASREEVPQ